MFASEFVIAVAAYTRGVIDIDALEEAAATSLLDPASADRPGMADEVVLGVAELDRGDITEDVLRDRLRGLAPEWVPSEAGNHATTADETLHEDEAVITVPAWVATRREAACA